MAARLPICRSGVPVLRGREFNDADGGTGNETVVINQTMAERFFRGTDPIGNQLRFAPANDSTAPPTEPWRTVVGISRNVLQGSAQDAFRNAVVYLPLRQEAPRTAAVLIRSTLPPEKVMADVRRVVQSLDADQPVFTIQTVAAIFAEASHYGSCDAVHHSRSSRCCCRRWAMR